MPHTELKRLGQKLWSRRLYSVSFFTYLTVDAYLIYLHQRLRIE